MHLQPILNHILFSFVDEVDSKGQFVKTTTWGLVIPGHFDDSAKKPRWAIVIARGSDVAEDIRVGDMVLIKSLKWTEGVKFEGERVWRTDDEQVACIGRGDQLIVRGKNIVFDKVANTRALSTSIAVSPGVFEETARGKVLAVAPDVTPELSVGTVLYYADKNFFNEFEHNTEKMWFLDEEEVLFYEPQVDAES